MVSCFLPEHTHTLCMVWGLGWGRCGRVGRNYICSLCSNFSASEMIPCCLSLGRNTCLSIFHCFIFVSCSYTLFFISLYLLLPPLLHLFFSLPTLVSPLPSINSFALPLLLSYFLSLSPPPSSWFSVTFMVQMVVVDSFPIVL